MSSPLSVISGAGTPADVPAEIRNRVGNERKIGDGSLEMNEVTASFDSDHSETKEAAGVEVLPQGAIRMVPNPRVMYDPGTWARYGSGLPEP